MTLPAQDIVERFWPAACDSIDGPHASVIHQMIQDGNGGYVRFSDYKSLTADNEALRAMSDAHREHAQSAVENCASLNRLLSVAESRADALAQALRGALVDQIDLLHTCRKYAEEARDDDTRRVRHIRADRIEERVNATRAALGDRP